MAMTAAVKDELSRVPVSKMSARKAELATLLRDGKDLTVNWPGRLSVTPVWSGLFFAQCGLQTLGEICLYIGLVLAIWATMLYIKEGSTST